MASDETVVDILELLVGVWVFWRILLPFGVSVALALALSRAFEPFTAGYCIAVVIVGLVLGIVWESR